MLKLKYICFISIDVVMWDIQITSYDQNLYYYYFFLWKIYNLCDYSNNKVTINVFFLQI